MLQYILCYGDKETSHTAMFVAYVSHSSLLCSAFGVVAEELPTVKRRLMLVFELVLLRLELDLRRPPRRGPDGGRPVERFNSFRKERPQDWAVKLHVSGAAGQTYLETYWRSALNGEGKLTEKSLVQFCSRTCGDKVSAVWIALAVESTSPKQCQRRSLQESSQGLIMRDPARL